MSSLCCIRSAKKSGYRAMPRVFVQLSQRQELHKAAARYYEAARAKLPGWDSRTAGGQSSGDTNSSPALDLAIAHHWLLSAEPIHAAKSLVAA
eukprot:SAG31_NODE_30130_length_385_cov_0.685315_1_plen_92_part_10